MPPTLDERLIRAGLAALLLGAASALSAQTTALPDSATAIVNVTVIPMDRDSALADQTVLVADGRITWVGPSRGVRIPAGTRRVDGRGKFLIPGLVDAHAHLSPGAGDSTDAAGRQFALLLANGVTTARGLVAPPNYLITRERARRGLVLAPTLLVAGPSINGTSAPTPEVARRMVEAAKITGYDWIKTHGGLTLETYDTMMATARRVGIPVSGHVTSGYGLAHAMASGQQIEHMDGSILALLRDGAPTDGADDQVVTDTAVLARLDDRKIDALAAATRRAGVASGITLNLFEIVAYGNVDSMAALPEMRFVTPQAIQAWRGQTQQVAGTIHPEGAAAFVNLRRRLALALYRAGATLLVSSDSPQFFMVPGFAVHGEMRAMAAAGIPPMAVLQAATRNASQVFGTDAEVGTVTAGKRADLVLLDADPRADISSARRIAGVMLRGRWLDAAMLQRLLEQAARQARPS